MKKRIIYIIILFFSLGQFDAYSQINCTVPLPPVLTSVSIQPETGINELNWVLSASSDIAAYLVYIFHDESGIPRGDIIDTIWNPEATHYYYNSSAYKYFSVSYVVSAYRDSKIPGMPGCPSPFSNVLNTIFTESILDTCNNKIEIKWNSYISNPLQVLSYSVLFSVNGGTFSEAAQVMPDKNSFTLNDFTTDSEYCFVVRANLEGGIFSTSNKSCLLTKMKQPPQWINADYATVVPGNEILLSFKIDPSSEIRNFKLEKKTGSQGAFQEIYRSSSVSGSMLYNDGNADISKINYYRLSAMNNCNTAVTRSNIASNIVLSLERNNDDIKFKWNPYKEWLGSVGSYILYANTGGVLSERSAIAPSDTALNISYSGLMYEVTGKEVCFMIKAVEASNPYSDPGESQSRIVCTPVTEVITIPNVFTPDNNGLNDLFWPFLSFTPTSYQLVITDLQRKTVFETKNPAEKWDGTKNGSPLPEGVYLWYLKVGTPSGKSISRTGNVTIIINR